MEDTYEVRVRKFKNTDKFRPAAKYFEENSMYTAAPPGTTEYKRYWDREMKRSTDGFTAEDGDSITGYHYFYLNYCPIMKVVEKEVPDGSGGTKVIPTRDRGFPNFWDYDKEYFDAVEEAENRGSHMAVLKKRRSGYSYKVAAMLNRNFFLIPESISYAIASEKEFLTKDGVLSKAWDMMSWIDDNTAWTKKRQAIDTNMHRRASFYTTKGGSKIEKGYKSEIIGVTLKNDPQKARGKAAKLIVWEESGKFPNLLQSWQIAQPSVEQDGVAFGTMISFGTGGCLTAGNKVFNNKGELINIEDLVKNEGIIGFDEMSGNYSKEDIAYQQPYTEKETIKLTTDSGRTIECSTDHPIYSPIFKDKGWNKYHKRQNRRIIGHDWKEAGNIAEGDLISVIDKLPIFGDKEVEDARLLGMLVGDGTYGNSTPKFANCDKELWDYIDDNYSNAVYLERENKDKRIYKEAGILNFNDTLRYHGIFGQTKSDKRLPKDVHKWNKKSISEFVAGLYDADGYISFRVNNKRKGKYLSEISLSQNNLEILKELQLILQKFGIHGKLRTRQPRDNNPKDVNAWHEFNISDCRSLTLFVENFNLLIKNKQEKLNNIWDYNKDKKPQRKYNGLRHEKVISIKHTGINPVYNLTASNTNTYLGNGVITHNTEEADYSSLKELFYKPRAYNVLPIRNVWDDGAYETACGFFVPNYMNMQGFMNEDGNSSIDEAIEESNRQRKEVEEHSGDKNSVDRYIAEHPNTPREATLQLTGNIFPKKELQAQKARIMGDKKLKNYKQVGSLEYDGAGRLRWNQLSGAKDIEKFPLDKNDSKEGAIVIWEHPVEDPPYGLYIAGIDPYDHDDSGTSSLGSTIIYKRFQSFEQYYDIIVAEYTGRPDTANEYYENVYRLLKYYNARALYENERKGMYAYFANKGVDYMLANQPDIIHDIVQVSKVQRKKGIHMTKGIKDWAEREIRDWLNEEYSPGHKNLEKIFSLPLLDELISYNDKGNFDRVISLMMVMLYKKELHNVHVKDKKRSEKTIDKFFQTRFFTEDRKYNFNRLR